MPDAKARARKIKLLLFDVDGVLTDGKLFFLPAPPNAQQTVREHAAKHGGQGGFGLASETMVEVKGFHAHDGTAISLARLGGIRTGLITKRISETVALRARDLKLEYVYQGIQDKLTTFKEILGHAGLEAAEAAFVGDDVIDLPVMWNCGLSIAVANARDEVKQDAHYVTEHCGGDGALRDAVEFCSESSGQMEKCHGWIHWRAQSGNRERSVKFPCDLCESLAILRSLGVFCGRALFRAVRRGKVLCTEQAKT